MNKLAATFLEDDFSGCGSDILRWTQQRGFSWRKVSDCRWRQTLRSRPARIKVTLMLAAMCSRPIGKTFWRTWQLPKYLGDAKISPMKNGLRDHLFRRFAVLMAFVFAIASMTSLICPVCLAQELAPAQHAGIHSSDHHHGESECDKDGCSCCGFQFLTPIHQTGLEARDSARTVASRASLELRDYASDFYHPPRA